MENEYSNQEFIEDRITKNRILAAMSRKDAQGRVEINILSDNKKFGSFYEFLLKEDIICFEYNNVFGVSIDILPANQDLSQSKRAYYESKSFSGDELPVTAQRKKWEVSLTKNGEAEFYISVGTVDIWNFKRDPRFYMEHELSNANQLTLNEVNTLKSVKIHKKIRPDGTQNQPAKILLQAKLISFDGERYKLTEKGEDFLLFL